MDDKQELKELKRFIEYAVDRIDQIKKAAEPEKPELRRGGYGVDQNGPFFLHENSHSWMKEYERGTGSGILSSALNKKGNDVELARWAAQLTGNIFDELKALQEDVEDFTMPDELNRVHGIDFRMSDDGQLYMVTTDTLRGYRIKDIPALILKLRQMEQTAKRKK